jgi:4-carboxymuconolactone decarboxylase
MARIENPSDRLSPQGRELLERLAGKRGRVDDMFRTMLLNPELTEAVSTLGTYLRFGSSALGDREREFAILRLARSAGAPYEWVKHEAKAREAGVDEPTIDALRRGAIPEGLDRSARDVLAATDYLLRRDRIPDELQRRLIDELGEPGLVELAVLVGFYAMIAGFLAAFEIPLPEGADEPF